MIKLDLITGFLGSGKTTFIKRYARYLISSGEKICIIENDFGAINVDMVMLKELESEKCNLEMIVGGDGQEAHRRRLKTKLIAMAMQGFDRVIIEPSGVFDPDEFFDLVYEEPLDKWYETGNVICIVDPTLDMQLSESAKYILATEASVAGIILFSKVNYCTSENISSASDYLKNTMKEFGCLKENQDLNIIAADWEKLSDSEYIKIINSGYNKASYTKLPILDSDKFDTVFYFDFHMEENTLTTIIKDLFSDPECGYIHRIKGVVKGKGEGFYEVNANRKNLTCKAVNAERAILIVIGEKLEKKKLASYLGNPTL